MPETAGIEPKVPLCVPPSPQETTTHQYYQWVGFVIVAQVSVLQQQDWRVVYVPLLNSLLIASSFASIWTKVLSFGYWVCWHTWLLYRILPCRHRTVARLWFDMCKKFWREGSGEGGMPESGRRNRCGKSSFFVLGSWTFHFEVSCSISVSLRYLLSLGQPSLGL